MNYTPTDTLPVVTSLTSADSVLLNTDSNGTSIITPDNMREYMSDKLMVGYVPYGKELNLSWSEIHTKTAAGNFDGIHVGDYKTITMTDSAATQVVMEVAGIDTYYRYGSSAVGHHIDFISRDCWKDETVQWNTTNNNNGTSDQASPWLASNVYTYLNDASTGVIKYLPSEVSQYVITKHFLLESRYSASGTISSDNSWAWGNMGKLWLPTEVEVFGCPHWSDAPYGTGGSVQYPLFVGGMKHIIKNISSTSSTRAAWWLSSVSADSSTHCCFVYGYGNASNDSASGALRVPLCFRIA